MNRTKRSNIIESERKKNERKKKRADNYTECIYIYVICMYIYINEFVSFTE